MELSVVTAFMFCNGAGGSRDDVLPAPKPLRESTAPSDSRQQNDADRLWCLRRHVCHPRSQPQTRRSSTRGGAPYSGRHGLGIGDRVSDDEVLEARISEIRSECVSVHSVQAAYLQARMSRLEVQTIEETRSESEKPRTSEIRRQMSGGQRNNTQPERPEFEFAFELEFHQPCCCRGQRELLSAGKRREWNRTRCEGQSSLVPPGYSAARLLDDPVVLLRTSNIPLTGTLCHVHSIRPHTSARGQSLLWLLRRPK